MEKSTVSRIETYKKLTEHEMVDIKLKEVTVKLVFNGVNRATLDH